MGVNWQEVSRGSIWMLTVCVSVVEKSWCHWPGMNRLLNAAARNQFYQLFYAYCHFPSTVIYMPSKFFCRSVARAGCLAVLFSLRASNRHSHQNEQRHYRDKSAEGNEWGWNLVSLVTSVLLGQTRINRPETHFMLTKREWQEIHFHYLPDVPHQEPKVWK